MTLNPFTRLASLGWSAWLATLAATACLCAVLAYWFMQLAAPSAPIAPVSAGPAIRDRPDLTQAGLLFGSPLQAQAAAVPVLGNVQVIGVVAAGQRGSAILIVDGKPARSFAVGERIGPGQRVRTVRPDAVVIDDNGRIAEVAAPLPTSTAVLTSGAGKARTSTDPALASPAAPGYPGSLPGQGMSGSLPGQGAPSSSLPAQALPGAGIGSQPAPPYAVPPAAPVPAPPLPGSYPMPGQPVAPANNLVKPGAPTS